MSHEPAFHGKWTDGQWPDNICIGFLRCEKSSREGYVFRDASHGIPVLGHVTRAVYHGSYPDQSERIARRLVACWNAMAGKTDAEVEAAAEANVNAAS